MNNDMNPSIWLQKGEVIPNGIQKIHAELWLREIENKRKRKYTSFPIIP